MDIERDKILTADTDAVEYGIVDSGHRVAQGLVRSRSEARPFMGHRDGRGDTPSDRGLTSVRTSRPSGVPLSSVTANPPGVSPYRGRSERRSGYRRASTRREQERLMDRRRHGADGLGDEGERSRGS